MSQYVLSIDTDLQVLVGWDNPMMTFFGQVSRVSADDAEQQIILWVGDEPRAYQTVDALQEALASVCQLPGDVVRSLRQDRLAVADRGPTPLQRAMLTKAIQ